MSDWKDRLRSNSSLWVSSDGKMSVYNIPYAAPNNALEFEAINNAVESAKRRLYQERESKGDKILHENLSLIGDVVQLPDGFIELPDGSIARDMANGCG